ncbi:MAG: dolichol-phosphate mannosyltransferase [Proteobacteria bacterium]|nr:MAG: dolichol-phosphate mannosyltransferase [Pseudomonadota bacterium]
MNDTTAAQAAKPQLSVIVPVGARRADLKALYADYKAGVAALGLRYEFIFVLDGPRLDAARTLDELRRAGEEFMVVRLTRYFGEAAALMAGFERCTGDIVLTLAAYHQIEPGDIARLVGALQGTDIAIGRRWPRHGNALDKLRRRTFHAVVRFATGLKFHDLGCAARAMRRQVLEEIDLYGDQHRFIPVLADRLGFRVSEITVRQHALDRTKRIYRPREYLHYLLDLFSIFFLVRFTKKPLRFFGMVGAATFSAGALLMVYLTVQRLVLDQSLAERPALLLGALLIVLGMQIFALGLLGELIIFTHARDLKDYRVEEVIHYPESAAPDPADPSSGAPSPQGQPTAPAALV